MDTRDITVDTIVKISNTAQALILDYVSSRTIFGEEKDLQPQPVGQYSFLPWGHDNQLPYNVLAKIEEDETAKQCLLFNSEMCYAGGIKYNTDLATPDIQKAVEEFWTNNSRARYHLGVCTDLKNFGFAVTCIILSKDGKTITNIFRKEAMYCRKGAPDAKGHIPYILYANWRDGIPVDEKKVERITLLDPDSPFADLQRRLKPQSKKDGKSTPATSERKFAILTEFPTVDTNYYPIPYFGSLLKSKWYDIKQLIALAKYAKLKNGASLKYVVAITDDFWQRRFDLLGISGDIVKEKEERQKFKKEIIEYLTGAENAGKTLFTGCYIDPNSGKAIPDVMITVLDQGKEGGDWESDFAEAVNMVCFAMGVHSNLVGSVPGKSQSNNSGSDKRELYTIAQTRQVSSHDLLLEVHNLLKKFNGWEGVTVEIPVIQLTTLDEHKDKKETNPTEE